jgi:hypothetical protein
MWLDEVGKRRTFIRHAVAAAEFQRSAAKEMK